MGGSGVAVSWRELRIGSDAWFGRGGGSWIKDAAESQPYFTYALIEKEIPSLANCKENVTDEYNYL